MVTLYYHVRERGAIGKASKIFTFEGEGDTECMNAWDAFNASEGHRWESIKCFRKRDNTCLVHLKGAYQNRRKNFED